MNPATWGVIGFGVILCAPAILACLLSGRIDDNLADPTPADVEYVRSLEPADDWMAVADAVQDDPCLDPVNHSHTGCLRCITALEVIRSIADDLAWDVAYITQLGGAA